MTDTRGRDASRRITAGWMLGALSLLLLLYGGFNFAQGPQVDRIPPLIPLISLVLGTSLLILGTILLVDGWTARWQMEMKSHRAARESAGSGLGAAPSAGDAPARHAAVPGGDTGGPGARAEIPGRPSLEEPATKKCPGCGKAVYKDARVCRFCGRAFGVTLRLKVYPPQEKKKREEVVGLLAKKLKMPADDVAHLLDLGMRFKYDSPEKLAAARTKFESLGCATEVYEKVGRE
jgi:ribosomal protein L37E